MNSNKSGQRRSMAITEAWHCIGQSIVTHAKSLGLKWQRRYRVWCRYAQTCQGEKTIYLWLQLMLVAALALHIGTSLYMGQTVIRLIQY